MSATLIDLATIDDDIAAIEEEMSGQVDQYESISDTKDGSSQAARSRIDIDIWGFKAEIARKRAERMATYLKMADVDEDVEEAANEVIELFNDTATLCDANVELVRQQAVLWESGDDVKVRCAALHKQHKANERLTFENEDKIDALNTKIPSARLESEDDDN